MVPQKLQYWCIAGTDTVSQLAQEKGDRPFDRIGDQNRQGDDQHGLDRLRGISTTGLLVHLSCDNSSAPTSYYGS